MSYKAECRHSCGFLTQASTDESKKCLEKDKDNWICNNGSLQVFQLREFSENEFFFCIHLTWQYCTGTQSWKMNTTENHTQLLLTFWMALLRSKLILFNNQSPSVLEILGTELNTTCVPPLENVFKYYLWFNSHWLLKGRNGFTLVILFTVGVFFNIRMKMKLLQLSIFVLLRFFTLTWSTDLEIWRFSRRNHLAKHKHSKFYVNMLY